MKAESLQRIFHFFLKKKKILLNYILLFSVVVSFKYMGKYLILSTFVDLEVTQQAVMVEPCQIPFKVMERMKFPGTYISHLQMGM